MKNSILAAITGIILFASCSGTVDDYRFTCTMNGNKFSASEIPLVSISNGNMTVNAYTDSSRFLLTTSYQGTGYFYTSDDTTATALIQYWPDKNILSQYFTSSMTATQGEIHIIRLTSSSMEGTFHGIISRSGYPDIQLQNGDFFGQRP